MMACSDIEELLSSYMDYELLPEERLVVEKHLAYCPSCRQTLEDLQRTSNLLKNLPNLPMPEDFQTQLHELLTGVNRDTLVQENKYFGYGWLRQIFSSTRMVAVALVLMICIITYSFTTFYKNISYTDQAGNAPALMNAEIAQDQETRNSAPASKEAGKSAMDENQAALTADSINQDTGIKWKERLLPLIIALELILLLMLIRIFTRLHRKR